MLALCQPPPADLRIQELYARMVDGEWEAVLALGEPLLGQPTDALAVLEAMSDALENLIHDGAAGFEPLQKRIAAQLALLKRAGARSTICEDFLTRSMKD